MKNYVFLTALIGIFFCSIPSCFAQAEEQDDDPTTIDYLVQENPQYPMPDGPCDIMPPLEISFSHTQHSSLDKAILVPGEVVDGYGALLGDLDDPSLGIRASVNGVDLAIGSHALFGTVYSVCCGCTRYDITVDINVEQATITIAYIPVGMCLDCEQEDDTGNEGQ